MATHVAQRLGLKSNLQEDRKGVDDRGPRRDRNGFEDAIEVLSARLRDPRVRLDAALRQLEAHEARIDSIALTPNPAAPFENRGHAGNRTLLQMKSGGKAVLGDARLAPHLEQRVRLSDRDRLTARRLIGLVKPE